MKKNIVELFKVFSDPNRMEIVKLLLEGEVCGCTLIDKVSITQPTLSYHLKTITASGLAIAKREGNWIKHYVDKNKIDEMIEYLTNLKNIEANKCNL